MKNQEFVVRNEISTSHCVKYLGVFSDQNLNFQTGESFEKMACRIKLLYAIRESFPEKTRIMILIALVISHVNYSPILLNRISENLLTTLEKQPSWAV